MIHLDTHAVVWLYARELSRFSILGFREGWMIHDPGMLQQSNPLIVRASMAACPAPI